MKETRKNNPNTRQTIFMYVHYLNILCICISVFYNFISVNKAQAFSSGCSGVSWHNLTLSLLSFFCVFLEGANSTVHSSLELAAMILISRCLHNFTAFLILPMIISRKQGIR